MKTTTISLRRGVKPGMRENKTAVSPVIATILKA
jgi:hypothetical protein